MANINAVNMSWRKDCKEECADLTADEHVSPLYENISMLGYCPQLDTPTALELN